MTNLELLQELREKLEDIRATEFAIAKSIAIILEQMKEETGHE